MVKESFCQDLIMKKKMPLTNDDRIVDWAWSADGLIPPPVWSHLLVKSSLQASISPKALCMCYKLTSLQIPQSIIIKTSKFHYCEGVIICLDFEPLIIRSSEVSFPIFCMATCTTA